MQNYLLCLVATARCSAITPALTKLLGPPHFCCSQICNKQPHNGPHPARHPRSGALRFPFLSRCLLAFQSYFSLARAGGSRRGCLTLSVHTRGWNSCRGAGDSPELVHRQPFPGVQGWGRVVLGWREATEERSRTGLMREENTASAEDDLNEKLIKIGMCALNMLKYPVFDVLLFFVSFNLNRTSCSDSRSFCAAVL